jgi:hypothetical protein
MPETFSFGLEERSSTLQAIKLELNEENPDCHHEWYERGEPAQTLRHEGKTILECRGCKRTVAVFDWKLNNASS